MNGTQITKDNMLLGVPLEKWFTIDDDDRTAAMRFSTEVEIFGLKMVADAIRVEGGEMHDAHDGSEQTDYCGTDESGDEDLNAVLKMVAPDGPYGWHGQNEGGYGYEFNPIEVPEWEGFFGIVIASVKYERDA